MNRRAAACLSALILAACTSAKEPTVVDIGVSSDGRYWLEGSAVALPELEARLRTLKAPAGRLQVHLLLAKSVRYRDVGALLVVLNRVDVEVGLLENAWPS